MEEYCKYPKCKKKTKLKGYCIEHAVYEGYL